MRERDEPPHLSRKGVAATQMAQPESHAEMMLVHENAVVKMADDVPFDRLAPRRMRCHHRLGASLNMARVQPGNSVAVVGWGGADACWTVGSL